MVLLLVASAILAGLVYKILKVLLKTSDILKDSGYKDGWFGRGIKSEEDNEDTTIHPFTINVQEDVLSDLKRRLQHTRLEEPLEESKFRYGFNSKYLSELVTYWKDEYDWRKQETQLNKYPHFLTKIEGIDIHFLHVVPEVPNDQKLKVYPLLIIHGWPGCFVEFYKIIPLLTTPNSNRDFAFEVICPSIPGFGFSEPAHKKGLSSRAAARIFTKLMERIGHETFYVQGGDWGSNISLNISRFYPNRVAGLHLNMILALPGWTDLIKYVLIDWFPFLISKEEYRLMHPIRRKMMSYLQEGGYFSIQVTKPDTIGCALSDSPAGLAAYLLEKVSVATNFEFTHREDGGLTEKFKKDELLTNCMIYWVTNTATSAARFYRESMRTFFRYDKYPITVPTGFAVFPNEILVYPRTMLSKFKNIVSYTLQPKGGHFAAMEEPKLLAEDIFQFVQIVNYRRN